MFKACLKHFFCLFTQAYRGGVDDVGTSKCKKNLTIVKI